MALSREDVVKIAALARLELDEAEVEPMLRDLARILAYVEQLSELDTRDVPATARLAVERLPLRDDTTLASLDAEVALGEAPRRAAGGFAVPAFVEEG
jgi:aspartyl-tRNA(Asn)/glutamyl-tRNA(Gln) amidotransferase subunit C